MKDFSFNPLFLPNPNMAKLTARKNTTELLIVTESAVTSENQNKRHNSQNRHSWIKGRELTLLK